MQALRAIDFHHHARPASFWERCALARPHGASRLCRSPRDRAGEDTAMMDDTGIALAVLSSPDADTLFADRAFALETARPINEFYAGIIHAGRTASAASSASRCRMSTWPWRRSATAWTCSSSMA